MRSSDDSVMLRQIIEATPTAMLVVDASGAIKLVNAMTERSFGYTRDELLGMNAEDLIPERFHAQHRSYRSMFFDRPSHRVVGAGQELLGRRSDGSEIPVEIGLNPLDVQGEPHLLASVVDIRGRLELRAIEDARQSDRLRRTILDSLPFSIIASDHDGTIVSANPAAERLLGFERGELVGSPIEALRGTVTDDTPITSAGPGAFDEREVDYLRKDGTTVPVNEAMALMGGNDGEVDGVLSVAYDITPRREAEAFVLHLERYDSLTDLPNRTMLVERLADDLRAAARTGRGVVVALIGLDHFKRINDALGHQVGDELLVQMAGRLQGHVRARDLVARLDGDEFAMVLTGVDGAHQVQDRIAGVLASLSEPILCNGHEVVVTASMGLAISPEAGDDPTTLVKHADTAMYHAKSSGRSAYRWFEDSMLDQTNDRLAMASALRQALDREELSVSYQPQVSLADDTVVGIEALARWQTPEGTVVSPDRFIPVAEDHGLITRLGEWVLRTACVDAMTMSDQTGIALRLAVNVSPRQFRDRSWLDVLQRALDDSGLPAHRLELEITEGIFMENSHEVIDVMIATRDLGVAIVVDDFGTGFSSLAYLTRFTVDKIKIDRSFVTDLAVDDTDAAIVDTIILMAHALGMTVVAEGVETAAQEQYLRERRCDVAQGYRYSPAVPPLDLMSQYL